MLVVKVKEAGQELKARVVSLQYGNARAIPAPPNALGFEWSIRRGTIEQLEQNVKVG
jgi:hypothetical protein